MLRIKSVISYVALFGVVSWTLISCNYVYKKNLTKEVSSFLGQTIKIPENIKYYGFNENPSYLKEGIPKIIVWFDSTDCAPCSVKSMYLYEEIESFCRDSLNGAELVFLFSPRNDENAILQSNLYASRPVYDVYVDENREMYDLNSSIPSIKELHVFLLDKNNTVQFSGRPVMQNKKMIELYKKKLEQLSSI